MMRAGGLRHALDAQRFAQLGSWEGTLVIDGEEIAVDPATWIGSRDRSWGIRPVGESEPPGRARPTRRSSGMWWLYVPDRLRGLRDLPDHPGGARRLPGPQRLHPGLAGRPGRAARLAARRRRLRLGHPDAQERRGHCTTPDGTPVTIEVESLLAVPIHVGGGYGGDPDWGHGQWKGAGLRRAGHLRHERPGRGRPGAVRPHRQRRPGGLARGGQGAVEGWGLYEHGVIGLHEPTGFTDWFIHAP